ncbi:MAG: DVUA0089 family protein, partial [Gemmataceae bacterium]|nr:DVUA0089 family protein [Gemmataceae bacterium]
MTSPRTSLALSILLDAGTAGIAWAGPTFEEVPDAGSTPATAQPVTGSGSTGRIKGELTATADTTDFEDMYLICISDPAAFSATVDPMSTNFDTQLWLFKLDGTGLLGNDNNAAAFPTVFSRLLPNATDGSGASLVTPGLYLLAITSKANKPASANGLIFNDPTIAGIEITGPDGAGGGLPFQQWTQGEGTTGGTYAIDLTGVKPFEVPCTTKCPFGAQVDDDAFDCTPSDPDINGGCTEPGTPLQNIGLVAPGHYIAVCGTTGVEYNVSGPASKDRDWFRFGVTAPGYLYAALATETLSGLPATNARITLFKGDDCATHVELAVKTDPACPLEIGPIAVTPGLYVIVVTLDGSLPREPKCPVKYTLWINERPTKFDACGNPDAAGCLTRHPSPGCDKPLCCDTICMIDPSCCEESWDGACVGLATNVCLGAPCPADLNGDDLVGGADLA